MNRVQFLCARILRQEAPLAGLSVTQQALLSALAGKSVAVIGNARALANATFGADIDSHDIVIRINRAPMPDAVSHGSKTDWLALATNLSSADRLRINAATYLWMSHKRKRLDWATATSNGFYLHPLAQYHAMKDRLGRQPTTGAMMIDLVAKSGAREINLYGFDFFSSLSLSGRRTADDVPHDFDAEAQFVRNLAETDQRVTLHPMK